MMKPRKLKESTHMQLKELVLQQRPDDCVKCRAEVHTQDPGVSSWRVQILEDEVKSHVDSVVYRIYSAVMSYNKGRTSIMFHLHFATRRRCLLTSDPAPAQIGGP